MATVTLTTLFSFDHDVELPESCPHCGADLHGDDALRVWRWVDESRVARLPRPTDKAEAISCGTVYDWDRDSNIDSGDSTLDGNGYYCSACEKQLADGACWDLNFGARDGGVDARLPENESQATLECGCVLRREPTSIEFCDLHRGITLFATRLRRGEL